MNTNKKDEIINRFKSQYGTDDYNKLIEISIKGRQAIGSNDWRLWYDNERELGYLMQKQNKERINTLLAIDCLDNETSFSITSYFDPYGDGKSDRKLFSRKFFKSNYSKETIESIHLIINRDRSYYDSTIINFKQYKSAKTLDNNSLVSNL
jgi:hypothetical protein